jgi:ABC-type polar amino acid transport system ATPase subunit
MIDIANVNYTYPGGTQALYDVTVQLPPEHIFAVMGESGSGKTTLLKCLGRFLEPDSGTISVQGEDIRELSEAKLRRSLGIVFQRLFLFPHMTVLRNMTLAPEKALGMERGDAEAGAREMLGNLGIDDLADRYPSQISGGQAQRAAIARGLMLHPKYMLLDEPTSALDAKTTDDFAVWLTGLREDTSFVIVTHDLLFAERVASRGVFMAEGRVEATGKVGDIIGQVKNGVAEGGPL